jgi:hypothetical protein
VPRLIREWLLPGGNAEQMLFEAQMRFAREAVGIRIESPEKSFNFLLYFSLTLGVRDAQSNRVILLTDHYLPL